MMNSKAFFILLLLILPDTGIQAASFCDIIIINSQNKKLPLRVELALTEEEKSKGLMNRKNLGKNNGMLFIFNYEKNQNFWMKNTYLPLSIAYLDKNGIIREIYDMKPLDTSITYPSKYPSLYALEVNQGWFTGNKIIRGNKVIINGCIGK